MGLLEKDFDYLASANRKNHLPVYENNFFVTFLTTIQEKEFVGNVRDGRIQASKNVCVTTASSETISQNSITIILTKRFTTKGRYMSFTTTFIHTQMSE